MRKLILILVLVLFSFLSVGLGSATFVDENKLKNFDLESETLFFSQQNFDSKIRYILSNVSSNNIDPDHLVLSSSYLTNKSGDLSIMKYVQKLKGLDIYSSRMIVGIKGGKIVTLKSNYYPEKDIDTEPTLKKEDIIEIIEKDMGSQLIRGVLKPRETFSFEELEANKSSFVRIITSENKTNIEDILLVIYPESRNTEIKFHLAYKVELGLNIFRPSKWVYFIDANNGEILEKYNKVVFTTLSGNVTGRIYPEHPNQSLVVRNFWNETLYDFTDHVSNIFWSGKNDTLDNYIFTKNPINITDVSSATLEFKTKFFMENEHDFGYVVISTDGSNYSNFEEYTGIKTDWSAMKIDLSSYIGQKIWIGFRYITDNINYDNGWYIDDITILTNNGSIFKDSADNFTNWNEKGFSIIQQEVTSNQELGKTGADGFYSFSGLQDSFTLYTGLAGEFVDVFNETGVNANHYATITTPATHDIDWGNDDTSYRKELSNVFYHINVVHDFFTKGSPFNIYAMNYQTHAHVQYAGTCNAFSDGTNIYFSGVGGGCESSSLFSDIIYHEYTHNVIDHIYTTHAPLLPYRVESGALNEGLADYFASSINGNPCIAEGLDGDCIRNLNYTYKFPEDIAGETHKDGRIISGSLWDLRKLLGSDISDSLIINSMKLEPFNFSEYLDDIIVADDNNSNLEDGTPHLFEICTAFFENHGILSPYCSMYYPVTLTVNLLKNPGFESESANWTEYSNGEYLIIKKNPMGTYSGNWLAYMGNYNNMDQYIFQDITIPSRIEKAYVQFWYWITSKETTEGSENDTMRIEIRKVDDDTLLKSLETLSNLNKSEGYSMSEQYDLTEFKNLTIRLKLSTKTDSSNPTAFLVDDIALMVVYDTTPPDIDLVPPTPLNNSNLSQNSIIVNMTASEILNDSILVWDGVNETMAGSGMNWNMEKTGLNDGKYVYKVWCNDSSGNWNETEARVVTVDTRPPIITANPTGYPENQMLSKNGDTIIFNTTIIDPVSNIKNATVSVSQINNTLDRIVLDPNNQFWTNSSVVMNASDGQYSLNISAYDYAGNVNNTEYLTVIVDTTPPIVLRSHASHQQRDTADNLSIIEFNVSANDPLVNGISGGIRNASVNTSLINSTGIIELVNISGFWKGSVIVDKLMVEGNYSMNVTVYDNAGNMNDSTKVYLSIDSTSPSVTEVSLTSLVEIGNSNKITAIISDNIELNRSDVYLRVKYPNGSSENLLMNFENGNTTFKNLSALNGDNGYLFSHNFTDTAQYGRYDVNIIAKDTMGNANNSEETWFVTTRTNSSQIKIRIGSEGEHAYGLWSWNRTNFPGLILDETLNLQHISGKTIEKFNLWYNTSRQLVRYKVNEFNSSMKVDQGLDSNGNKVSQGEYYAKIGWQGIPYVTFDGKANKISRLILEHDSKDSKTLLKGETWDLGEGFSLKLESLDPTYPEQAWLTLSKRGRKLDDKIVANGSVYTFSIKSSASENDAPIFVTYADNISSNSIKLHYTWLISDNITTITSGDIFGNLRVVQLSQNSIYLTNENDSITLSKNTTANLMDSLYFRVTNNATLEYYPFFKEDAPEKMVFELSSLSLEIFADCSVDDSIEIREMVDIPPGMNRSLSLIPLGKYISVNSNVGDNLNSLILKIYYTEDELKASSLDENSLQISWYNESSNRWEIFRKDYPSWVNDAGINTDSTSNYSGFVWGNISHLSTFAIAGRYPVPLQPDGTGGGGSGGAGGSGGGVTGENFSNVELKEGYEKEIFKDRITSFRFGHKRNPIAFVNITGNVNAGLITTVIEVLRDTSTLIKPHTPAPGIIFKNMNIWVGTTDFALPKNIKTGLIRFSVPNTWLENKSVQPSEMKMARWDGNNWLILETEVKERDSTNTYLEAITDRFSPFSIIGLKKVEPSATSVITITPLEPESTPAVIKVIPEEKPIMNWRLIFGVIILICIIALFISVSIKTKRNEEIHTKLRKK